MEDISSHTASVMRTLQTKIGQAWISHNALIFMVGEFKRAYPNETGGVLLGYWSAPNSAVITHAIGPGPNAVHDDVSFIPDCSYHESEIARLYEYSGRIHTYLGDWHSHPNSCTELSSTDRRTLSTIAKHKEARVRTPLMAIIARHDPPDLRIWQYRPARLPVKIKHTIVSLDVRPFS